MGGTEVTEPKAEAKVVARGELVVNVRSGKQVAMSVPVDMTETDILDLASYITTNLDRELKRARGSRGLFVATGPLGGPKT